MSDDCNSCGGSVSDASELPLPVAGSEVAVVETTIVEVPCKTVTKEVHKVCADIKDNCGCPPPDAAPWAKISNTHAFAMPACNQEVEVLFDKKVEGLVPGLELFGLDSLLKTIRLRIKTVTPDYKLVLVNTCNACCNSTKPIGESIPALIAFTWGIPQCCSSTTQSNANDCLVGTFFFPAIGATSPANVQNSFNFAVGGIYSLAGFLWKVTARVTSTQILLQNLAPGNGSTVGGFVDGGDGSNCTYPITPVSDTDSCNDAPEAAVALLGCTASGVKKLTGPNCGIPVLDTATGLFTVKQLLNGSLVAGPHYIEYDPVNPCNSRLVHSPELSGALCTTITGDLFLVVGITTYEIEVASTAGMTTSAPGNIVTISGREFNVTAIITPGAPGKIRITPRFTISISETIPENSQLCIVSGCQPFPASDWPYGGTLLAQGTKIFCSPDGLRGVADHNSTVSSTDYDDGDDINIADIGNYPQGVQSYSISNPSVTRLGHVSGVLTINYQLTLDTDGEWAVETLFDVDAVPSAAPFILRAMPIGARFDVQLVTNFSLTVNPGVSRTIQFNPRVRTINASANTGVRFHGYTGRLTTHLMTSV
jgi:hypothetical protein